MSDAYILCATPRSGSTLLCGLLASAGAGDPDSYWGEAFIDDWAKGWRLPSRAEVPANIFERAYFNAALRAGRGGTETFGLRLMQPDLPAFCAALGRLFPGPTTDKGRIEAAFGNTCFIHLFRADTLGQAISRVKAEQTGLWHIAPDGTEIERLAPPASPSYDFARIRREVLALEQYDLGWSRWFEAEGVTPIRVRYEDLSADPASVLVVLCEVLALPPPHRDSIRPGVARLADATSRDWADRYRRDLGS